MPLVARPRPGLALLGLGGSMLGRGHSQLPRRGLETYLIVYPRLHGVADMLAKFPDVTEAHGHVRHFALASAPRLATVRHATTIAPTPFTCTVELVFSAPRM